MPAEWRIEQWPPCVAHVFLSHCAEDRDQLVVPVYKALQSYGILPWIDRHHYPVAREAFETLREELLKCRHVVYFITPALLRQGRGWTQVERAYSSLIQQRLRYGTSEISRVELPLLFVPRGDLLLARSMWRSLVDKFEGCPRLGHTTPIQRYLVDSGRRRWTDQHIDWATETIKRFVRQEQDWAITVGITFGQDTKLSDYFSTDANQRRRILAQSPTPLP